MCVGGGGLVRAQVILLQGRHNIRKLHLRLLLLPDLAFSCIASYLPSLLPNFLHVLLFFPLVNSSSISLFLPPLANLSSSIFLSFAPSPPCFPLPLPVSLHFSLLCSFSSPSPSISLSFAPPPPCLPPFLSPSLPLHPVSLLC